MSVSDPEAVLAGLETSRVKFGLNRIKSLIEHLGREARPRAPVLVAGTNGKGSTAAILASIATAAGLRTGLFTSPHLESVEERIRIDGVSVNRRDLADLLKEILERSRAWKLEDVSYFELLTAAAAVWFTRKRADLTIFEVGLGGRLDATNVFEPILSVITEIGLDHCKQLGHSLKEIAGEKAGILRPEVPSILGATAPEAALELDRLVEEMGARKVDISGKVVATGDPSRVCPTLRLDRHGTSYSLDFCLPGRHQWRNLVLAVVAAEELARLGLSEIDRSAVERGVARVNCPGRLERVVLPSERRLAKHVWLDAAHNPLGARRLADFLSEHAGQVGSFDLLFGVMADKDAKALLDPLAPLAGKIFVTTAPSVRARRASDLESVLPQGRALAIDDPLEALGRALGEPNNLVVCGSLYLVGEVRRQLRRLFGRPKSTELLFDTSLDTMSLSGDEYQP